MKRAWLTLCALGYMTGAAGSALAGGELIEPGPMDPPGTDVHMAYENATFLPGQPQAPGLDLAGPGDVFRYTIIRDDEYATSPEYEVLSALIGFHFDDPDATKAGGDTAPEWIRVEIDGEPVTFTPYLPFDKRDPISSEHFEVMSDEEFSPNPEETLFPPYIVDITALANEKTNIVVEIINLREDGTVEGDAAFGNIIVNRIGSQVYYKKK